MNSDQLIEELQKMLIIVRDFLVEFIPKLILGLFVLLAGFLIAKVIQSLVVRIINYLDRIINEKLRSKVLQVNLTASKSFIGKTFYWIILFIFVTLFTEIIGLPIITSWLKGLGQYLPNFLAAIVIVFFGLVFSRLALDLIKSGTSKAGIAYGSTLGRITMYVIQVITIVIAVDQIGIDITFLTNLIYILLATLLLGAALAFGLGAQASVSNILASYYINRNYRVGDTIQMGDHEGRIIKITSTNVFLDTKSGQVIIPAKEFNEKRSVIIDKDKHE